MCVAALHGGGWSCAGGILYCDNNGWRYEIAALGGARDEELAWVKMKNQLMKP